MHQQNIRKIPASDIPYGLIRIILRVAAIAYLAVILLDFMTSGTVTIPAVQLQQKNNPSTQAISLPYDIRRIEATDNSFRLYITADASFLDQFRKLEIQSQSCLTEVTLNGINLLKSPAINDASDPRCEKTHGVLLTPWRNHNELTLTLLHKAGIIETTLITRQLMLDSLQSFLIGLISIYLLSVSFVEYRTQWSTFHYRFFVLATFVVTSFPIFDTMKDANKFYFGNIAEGIALPALFLISLTSATLRKHYGHLGQWLGRIGALPERYYLPVCMLVFFGMTAGFSALLFDHFPHIADTHAQYMHSKILAQGHLFTASMPEPLRAFFDLRNVYNNGHYYSHYPPGHIILLAIGQLLGAPWLVNPALGALTVYAVYLLARELSSKASGYIAAALSLVSPFLVFMSSEYMNHASTLLFATLFLFAYIRWQKTTDWRFAAMSGLCLGYGFISRPQTLLFFAFPVVFHCLKTLIAKPCQQWRLSAIAAAFFMIPLAFFLYYNFATRGDPLLPNQGADAMDLVHDFISHRNWRDIFDEVQLVIIQANLLHMHLFCWASSSLVFVGLLFLFRMHPPYATLVLACVFAQAAELLIIEYFDTLLGPRYLYETSGALIALSAIGLERIPAMIRKCTPANWPITSLHGATACVVGSFILLGIPFVAMDRYRYYKENYWEGNAAFVHTVMDHVEKPALVFVRPFEVFRFFYFTEPPLQSNPVIVALDRGENNHALMDFYPNRNIYMFDGGILQRVK